nr:winged helix-turn-helix transcriptional regulator [Chloroflexota bacterium]
MKNHTRGLELIKVLAHPVRVQILWALGAGEQYVCHLMTSLNRRQAYVSQQLAFLRQNNLIVATRESQHISYRLRDEELGELLSRLFALHWLHLIATPVWSSRRRGGYAPAQSALNSGCMPTYLHNHLAHEAWSYELKSPNAIVLFACVCTDCPRRMWRSRWIHPVLTCNAGPPHCM